MHVPHGKTRGVRDWGDEVSVRKAEAGGGEVDINTKDRRIGGVRALLDTSWSVVDGRWPMAGMRLFLPLLRHQHHHHQ